MDPPPTTSVSSGSLINVTSFVIIHEWQRFFLGLSIGNVQKKQSYANMETSLYNQECSYAWSMYSITSQIIEWVDMYTASEQQLSVYYTFA